MNDSRYKELMAQVGMPNSQSLLIALKQVANEVAQESVVDGNDIIGVAIRTQRVVIKLPKPMRHSDCFEYAERIGINIDKLKIGMKGKDQGFYTNTGAYLNRQEAFEFAKEKRLDLIDNPAGAICSENLW